MRGGEGQYIFPQIYRTSLEGDGNKCSYVFSDQKFVLRGSSFKIIV